MLKLLTIVYYFLLVVGLVDICIILAWLMYMLLMYAFADEGLWLGFVAAAVVCLIIIAPLSVYLTDKGVL